MEPIESLLPLDVGFDLRVTGALIRMSDLRLRLRYRDEDGTDRVTSGATPEAVSEELARAGYCVAAYRTPNGRDIQCTPAARAPVGAGDVAGPIAWAVQARLDNYWCRADSLAEALDRSGWGAVILPSAD